MKTFFSSRTVWLALIQAVTGGVVIFLTEMDMVGLVVVAKSVGDIMLRLATNEPITNVM